MRGRPKKYAEKGEGWREWRKRKLESGYAEIRAMVPKECKVIFDAFCKKNNMTQAEALSYLLYLLNDEES